MKIIESMVRAGILAGAVSLLPAAALGETGTDRNGPATAELVDHATVEARGGGAIAGSGDDNRTTVPNHAAAEARDGRAASGAVGAETTQGVPDHAAAEARTPAGVNSVR